MNLEATERSPSRWRVWPWVVLVLGLAASGGMWLNQEHLEQRRHSNDLRERAEAVRQEVQQRLLRCDRLLDAAAVWAGGAAVDDPAAWTAMARRLNVGQGDWCTDAITWYPRVEAAEREAWLQRARAIQGPAFAVRPAGIRDIHFPMLVAVPDTPRSRRFLGIDPWADPRRQADIQRAIDGDQVSASPVQRFTADEFVVLRYVPVRGTGGLLVGLIGAPLRLERLVAQLQAEAPDIAIALTADDDAGLPHRVQDPAARHLHADPDLEPAIATVVSAGRSLHVEVRALAAFHNSRSEASSGALPLAVGLLALMAALLVHALQRTGSRAHQLAQRMSEEAVQQRQEALTAEAQRQLLVEMVPIGVIHVGLNHCIVSANKAAHELLDWPDGTLVGRHMSEFHDADQVRERCAERSRVLGRPVSPGLELFELQRNDRGLPVESNWTLRRRDGSFFPAMLSSSRLQAPDGQVLGSVRVFTDISERHRAQEQMRFLALHDSLTGLANRTHLEQVGQEWLQNKAEPAGVALVLLDLNRFKQINDALGHPVGDELLRQVGRRLQDAVRPTDLVARMGGDEFVVMLQGITAAPQALAVADALRSAFDDDIEIGNTQLRVSASMGVALHPEHGASLPELLKAADLAMYRAKRDGSTQAVVYDPQQDVPDASRLRLERDLRLALGKQQFEMHYQPLVSAADGTPLGVEALLRWHHPSFGMVSPAEFVPMAETTGDIVPIGRWVLETACAEIVRQRERWPRLRLSVNLSVRQLEVPNFDRQVAEVLARTGLPPQDLELEITESLIASAQGHVPRALEGLRALGVRIAVDDFGTGYSSLQYLRNFPVDTLKIDRAFVNDLELELASPARRGLPLGLAIIAMARSLGLDTVAEGVETAAQRDALAEAGCHCLQGYHFSRAVPASRLAEALERLARSMAPA